MRFSLFFFNDTAATEIYTLSLHDALPISQVIFNVAPVEGSSPICSICWAPDDRVEPNRRLPSTQRSEEHTSELQSRQYLVCRLLLEKKKHRLKYTHYYIW